MIRRVDPALGDYKASIRAEERANWRSKSTTTKSKRKQPPKVVYVLLNGDMLPIGVTTSEREANLTAESDTSGNTLAYAYWPVPRALSVRK
jgi:hypothetical protein